MKIDLHLHTACSDGEQSVGQVAEEAKKAGLSAIAYTDHNTFAITEDRQEGELELIPGCEFSAIYQEKGMQRREIHIVGLFFEGVPAGMQEMVASIDKLAYPKALIRKLNDLGVAVTLQQIMEKYPDVGHIGRMHIARVLVEKGAARDTTEVFDKWIGNYSPHYFNPLDAVSYPTVEEVCRAVTACRGAIPILAHPFHYGFSRKEIETMIAAFRACSHRPMGIEVFYGNYGEERTSWLLQMAEKYDLLVSAGSDRHRADHRFVLGDGLLLQKMREAVCGGQKI